MRILYLTQWFEPEPNIIKGVRFVRALKEAGHEVTVVTGFPNYPSGKLYPGYRLRIYSSETIGGIRVVRLPLYPSHDASSFRRSLNYLTFFLSALAYCLCRAWRYDLAYVYHPPITTGAAAALGGWIWRLPLILDVQDLWPDTLAATGMTAARSLARPVGLICKFVYWRAAAITAQSAGIRGELIQRGVTAEKVTTIRNWSNSEDEIGSREECPDEGSDVFTFVYGGNFGKAQGLETVIAAVEKLNQIRQDIRVRLIGDGVEATELHRRAACLPGIVMEPAVSQAEILRIFASADALLLHLRDDPLFAITIPSKTQTYLAMGRPIVAGIAGEAADLLTMSGAAIVVPPGDPDALACAFRQLADLSAESRRAMGLSGRKYYREQFSFGQAMNATLALIVGTQSDLRLQPEGKT